MKGADEQQRGKQTYHKLRGAFSSTEEGHVSLAPLE
jgi:hypothetical protein